MIKKLFTRINLRKTVSIEHIYSDYLDVQPFNIRLVMESNFMKVRETVKSYGIDSLIGEVGGTFRDYPYIT